MTRPSMSFSEIEIRALEAILRAAKHPDLRKLRALASHPDIGNLARKVAAMRSSVERARAARRAR